MLMLSPLCLYWIQDHQDPGSGLPKSDPHCPGMAQHALVLGPGQSVRAVSSFPTTSRESFDTMIQPVSTQGSPRSQPSCLAPRASSIQAQGFSEEMATRIEACQRRSTRAIYESKWSMFKWCESNQVDVWSPSTRHIADILQHLFQEKHLHPSIIDGYRIAIADKIGNDRVNISKGENLTRLLDSFHRVKPKGHRGILSWNLSLVLHQLT